MKTTILICLLISCLCSYSGETKTGFATYYTTKSCQTEGNSGFYTASGAPFSETAYTCALRSRDFGKDWRVTCLETGKSVVVRLTDYGPGKGPTQNGVIIDLTPTAFRALGVDLRQGKVEVEIEQVTK